MSGQLHVITANFMEEMAHDTVIQECLCQFLMSEINTHFSFFVIDFSHKLISSWVAEVTRNVPTLNSVLIHISVATHSLNRLCLLQI